MGETGTPAAPPTLHPSVHPLRANGDDAANLQRQSAVHQRCVAAAGRSRAGGGDGSLANSDGRGR